jgi:hypothetical protein
MQVATVGRLEVGSGPTDRIRNYVEDVECQILENVDVFGNRRQKRTEEGSVF